MKRLVLCLVPVLFWSIPSVADERDPERILENMHDELVRNFEILQDEEKPPFYLSYEIVEDDMIQVTGSYGEVSGDVDFVNRVLTIDLRVGSPELDNTRVDRTPQRVNFGSLSVEAEQPLKVALWNATNDSYRSALSQLTQVESQVQATVEEEDKTGDFVASSKEDYRGRSLELGDVREDFRAKAKRYGLPFKYEDHIQDNSVLIVGEVETRWYVNSEGTKIATAEAYYRISISATTKAEDGMELRRYVSYEALTPEEFPDDDKVMSDVRTIIEELKEMRDAPIEEPYEGPAILGARAAGVFFHEILGHRLEGHRLKSVTDGQTFKAKLGEQILPKNFTMYFDPALRKYRGLTMWGFYDYDNQGVKGERVTVIENGILTGFLMSRQPMEGFLTSNGHGRRQSTSGWGSVSRQSNLILDVENPVSADELKEMLLERVREQGREFGLYIDDIQGGFAVTGRTMPNAFNVQPLTIYRLYTDGRKEFVRGIDLIGTPLTTMSRIEAGANDYDTFNGYCGAESGRIPVSAVSPSILISQIEVQKTSTSRAKPPILPNPVERDDDEVSMHFQRQTQGE
ncbi:MAG: TldD/PmbA family protein [Gammaproteobacteria bacterium]|nr:TldD/PmbA family protein [Gammaproteobacteria bacterium]MYF38203.1 TldD/PmbA family protein [Gammaproteobacteria bacterium]